MHLLLEYEPRQLRISPRIAMHTRVLGVHGGVWRVRDAWMCVRNAITVHTKRGAIGIIAPSLMCDKNS
jgi:hypothetical protein